MFFFILSVSEESQFHTIVSCMKIRQVAPKGATCFFYIYMYVRVYARVRERVKVKTERLKPKTEM